MKMSESIVNIAQALAAMKKGLTVVGMSGENKFDKYTYAKLEDYIKATSEILSANGFFIVTSVEKVEQLAPRTAKSGSQQYVTAVTIAMRLIHTSGEWLEISCAGEGQDGADKGIYKAITGARKYAIASLLGLATSDDPEVDEPVSRAPAPRAIPAQQANPGISREDIKSATLNWIAKIRQQNDIESLKQVFLSAKRDLKMANAGADILAELVAAKDTKRASFEGVPVV